MRLSSLSEQAVMDLVNDKVATYKRIRKVDFIDEVFIPLLLSSSHTVRSPSHHPVRSFDDSSSRGHVMFLQ